MPACKAAIAHAPCRHATERDYSPTSMALASTNVDATAVSKSEQISNNQSS
jgi:hypothetical protein